MSQTCETCAVKADNDDGYMIINKSDVTDKHEVIGEAPAAPKEPEAPTAPAAPAAPAAPKPGSKAALQAECVTAGIEFADNATVADLKALLKPAE